MAALPTLAHAAMAPLLVWVAFEDWARFRIRNSSVLALAACLAASWVSVPGSTVLAHALLGGATLLILAVAFARGWIGGGDAKLLALAFTFVGPGGALAYSLLLLGFAAAYAVAARARLLPARREDGRTRIPFGVSIAGAWLAMLAPMVRN